MKKAILVLSAAAITLSAPHLMNAQGGGGRPEGRGGQQGAGARGEPGRQQFQWISPLFKDITLSKEQQEKIEAINAKYHKSGGDRKLDSADRRKMFEDKDSVKAVRPRREGFGDSTGPARFGDQRRWRYSPEQQKEILDVLTPEQRTVFAKNKAEIEKRMKEIKPAGGDQRLQPPRR